MEGWKRRVTDASALVAFLGLAFVVGGVTLWSVELAPAANSIHQALFALVMHVLFGGVILVLGVHIERSGLVPEERFAVLVWCYGGFTLMFALSVWGHLDSIVAGSLTVAFASDFVIFTSLGGAFGVIAGVNWGRATKNQLLAEQNREQRETLALLTRLLSHDIRNDLAIIDGNASILSDHVDEEGESFLEVIRDHVEETDQLLSDAHALVESLDEEREFTLIDLSNVLEREVTAIKKDLPDVEVQTDIQSGITVEADSLIRQVFSNLLQNAVSHNDPDELTIRVSFERRGDTAEVTVSDNGVGISPEVRDRCFELGEQGPESDGDGIGLYLVSRLVDVYGGSVELDESSSGGARFRITIPTAAAASE